MRKPLLFLLTQGARQLLPYVKTAVTLCKNTGRATAVTLNNNPEQATAATLCNNPEREAAVTYRAQSRILLGAVTCGVHVSAG